MERTELAAIRNNSLKSQLLIFVVAIVHFIFYLDQYRLFIAEYKLSLTLKYLQIEHQFGSCIIVRKQVLL